MYDGLDGQPRSTPVRVTLEQKTNAKVRLTDYKVRVLEPRRGTAAKVRVLVEWSDHERSWATVGVSDNVIEASWLALVDAIRLELMRLTEKNETVTRIVQAQRATYFCPHCQK